MSAENIARYRTYLAMVEAGDHVRANIYFQHWHAHIEAAERSENLVRDRVEKMNSAADVAKLQAAGHHELAEVERLRAAGQSTQAGLYAQANCLKLAAQREAIESAPERAELERETQQAIKDTAEADFRELSPAAQKVVERYPEKWAETVAFLRAAEGKSP